MTPYEKAMQRKDGINYCDECDQFQIVGYAAYCKADGKLIHPLMMTRNQGFGPARNCDKRKKSITNADHIRRMSDDDLAAKLCTAFCRICDWCPIVGFCNDNDKGTCVDTWLEWLQQEVDK